MQITININEKEYELLKQYAKELELSEDKIMSQALRIFQLYREEFLIFKEKTNKINAYT